MFCIRYNRRDRYDRNRDFDRGGGGGGAGGRELDRPPREEDDYEERPRRGYYYCVVLLVHILFISPYMGVLQNLHVLLLF